jgi:tetratricopeptide (TPR) repeat protein
MARQVKEARAREPAAPSWWQRLRARVSMSQIEAWSTTMRTVFLNALFLVAIIIVLPVLVSQFRRDQVIIETFGVPSSIEEQGLSGVVVANRLWDGLHDVRVKSRTAKESIDSIPDARQVEFSFPDSGFSIDSLVFHLRKLFDAYETRISGEFVCGDEDCKRSGLRLRLRVIREGVDIIDMPAIGDRPERDYFAEAGAKVYELLDPFVAIAALSDDQPRRAITLARRLIRGHHKDAKWAYNLAGVIQLKEGEVPAAVEDFRAAVALDPGFLQARSNLGQALVKSGDVKRGGAEFDAVLRREPANVWALEGKADQALASGDTDGAVAWLLKAADAAPVDPRFLAEAGKILADRNRADEAIPLLRRSLELDPGYLKAFAYLGGIYVARKDYESAETVYRYAADYTPDDANATASHGRVLAILHRWNDAVARYRRATELDPGNGAYWLELGRCLTSLGRLDEALTVLGKARELTPANADVFLSVGDVHREAGRKPEAIAAYRKYLDLAPADAMMRPVAERFIEILEKPA